MDVRPHTSKSAQTSESMGSRDSICVPTVLRIILRATALKETVGAQMGTLISCVPGKLGYFEDEDGRCILERLV
jgi:hypothetical protein